VLLAGYFVEIIIKPQIFTLQLVNFNFYISAFSFLRLITFRKKMIKKTTEAIVRMVMNTRIIVEIIDAGFKFDWPSCKVRLLNIQ
jgi:hypothetical protein